MLSQVLKVLATPMVGTGLSQQPDKQSPPNHLAACQAQDALSNHPLPLPDQSQTSPSTLSPMLPNTTGLDVSHQRDQAAFEQTQRAVGNLLDALRTNNRRSHQVEDATKKTVFTTSTSEKASSDRDLQRPSVSPLESQSPATGLTTASGFTFPGAQDLIHSVDFSPADRLAAGMTDTSKPLDGDLIPAEYSQSQEGQNAGILEEPLAETVEEEELPPNVQTAQDTGQISAFAKLEFDDGPFYITTYSLELGRDARAYRAAKARHAAQKTQQSGEASGSGNSHPSSMSNREGAGSQVKGSVVSDRGGFYGVDDIEGEAQEADEERQIRQNNASQASNHSASSIVNPKDLYTQPPLPHFNYQAYPIEEYEREIEEIPAPVTSEHFPEQEEGFLLPIHHAPVKDDLEQDVANHRSVSRRHAKIFWEDDCFKFHVKGVNGTFVNEVHYPKGAIVPLREDVSIQIKGIKFQFKLPVHRSIESSEESDQVEDDSPNQIAESSSATSGVERTASPVVRTRAPLKVKLKNFNKPATSPPAPPVGPDGKPKRRGPGRPPKDGVMSKRERTAKERADREAAAKAANGGLTPEPSNRAKAGRSAAKTAADVEEPKPVKRKYTKRKAAIQEIDDVTPKLEDDSDAGVDDAPVTKRVRVNRSESPEYPKLENLSEHELQRPPYNYSILIYDLLKDSPKPLDLKGIYRGLKMKWPHFLYRYKDAKGWESSVRHNVNEDKLKIIEKVDRVGKGYSYRAKPGVDIEQHKKKRARSPPAAQKISVPPQQRYQQQPHHPPLGAYSYPPGHQQPPAHHGMYGHLVPTTMSAGSMSYAASFPPPAMQPGTQQMPSASLPQQPMPVMDQPASYPPYHSTAASAPNQSQAGTYANQTSSPPQPTDHVAHPATRTDTPNSAVPSQPRRPAPPGVSQFSPFLPTGLSVISTFESSLLDGVENPSDLPRIKATLASVRKRVFEGEDTSSLAGGETQDERTFLHYFRHILENDRFRNPGFLGWEAVKSERETQKLLPQPQAEVAAAWTNVAGQASLSEAVGLAGADINSGEPEAGKMNHEKPIPMAENFPVRDGKGPRLDEPRDVDQQTTDGAVHDDAPHGDIGYEQAEEEGEEEEGEEEGDQDIEARGAPSLGAKEGS